MATLIRPVTPPEVKRSPMAARDPTLARDEPDVGPVSRREWAGYIVWGILAVVITTFENWTAMPILAGLVVLGARVVFYPWPFREAES
jgi:hypothetical protein